MDKKHIGSNVIETIKKWDKKAVLEEMENIKNKIYNPNWDNRPIDRVIVKLEDDYVVLDNNVMGVYPYLIHKDRINNPIKLIWWIHHLCEKNWMDLRAIENLIELTTKLMNIKMYQGEG